MGEQQRAGPCCRRTVRSARCFHPLLQATAGGLAIQFSAAQHNQYAKEATFSAGGAAQAPNRLMCLCIAICIAIWALAPGHFASESHGPPHDPCRRWVRGRRRRAARRRHLRLHSRHPPARQSLARRHRVGAVPAQHCATASCRPPFLLQHARLPARQTRLCSALLHAPASTALQLRRPAGVDERQAAGEQLP